MNKPKVSVIIPVYNVEKYLERCLVSVINQTLEDIEIICINDASEDNSLDIIKEYAKSYKRIKYINFSSNRGVSAVRNIGLKEACGEYICFVDSDDWIDEDYIELMYDKVVETDSDIIFNRNMISYQNDKYYPLSFNPAQKNICDNSYIDKIKDTQNIFFGVCSKMYKSDFIKKFGLYFPENYVYEDMFFHFISFAHAEKIFFFSGSKYYYRKTDGSITSNITQESKEIIRILELIYDYYYKNDLLQTGIKIYFTMPFFNIQDEETYNAFKTYFNKAGQYILNSNTYNDLDKFFCTNIINTADYNDYIKNFPANVSISFIKRKVAI